MNLQRKSSGGSDLSDPNKFNTRGENMPSALV